MVWSIIQSRWSLWQRLLRSKVRTSFKSYCEIISILGCLESHIVQDAINFPDRIDIIWVENLTGVGHDFLTTGQYDHLCWVSKYWWVRLGRFGFWRLTWWFSKLNLHQYHRYCLTWKISRDGTWVSDNLPTWSSMSCSNILMVWNWRSWFQRLIWRILKLHLLQRH